MNHSAIIKD